MPRPKIKPSLEIIVGRLLRARKKTLATAESCTGGLIAHRITNVPGASRSFLGGVVSYSNESKIKLLRVPRSVIAKYGAVSRECAVKMAQGVQKVTGSDYAIAVTGIAGPSGGTKAKPVGTVHIAIAGKKGVVEKNHFFPHGREKFKKATADTALGMLRKILKGSGK